MRAIDRHAWNNGWRNWHPAEKLLPAFGLLLLTLVQPPLTTGPLVLASLVLAMVGGAGVPLRAVLGMLLAPLLFLLAGIPFLAVSMDFSNGLAFQFSAEGWRLALSTAARSLAAIGCLAFLALTTPLTDWAPLLRRIGVPAGVVELILLIYRLIFIFVERTLTGQRAQQARLGYSRFDRSLKSLGLLAGNVFQRGLAQARRLEIGLAARAYDGELRVLEPERALSWPRLALAMGGVGLIGLAGGMLARGSP